MTLKPAHLLLALLVIALWGFNFVVIKVGVAEVPPLMLTVDELEAAILGAQWVAARGDAALSRGAQDLIAKITVAVPQELQPVILDAALTPVSFRRRAVDSFDVGIVRRSIRERLKLRFSYADAIGDETTRTVWPFLIAYSEDIRMICAWCEMREDFRHFRTDRVTQMSLSDDRFPERVQTLQRRWKAQREAERARNREGGV